MWVCSSGGDVWKVDVCSVWVGSRSVYGQRPGFTTLKCDMVISIHRVNHFVWDCSPYRAGVSWLQGNCFLE